MITQNIIQGSGLGPVLYTIYSSDLKAVEKDTVLVKYADDITLNYPDQTDVSFENEFSNIKEWSKHNRLTINISKTKEIVFHRPNPHKFHAAAPLQDVQQVPSCRLLGTVISSSLAVRDHDDYILTVSSQRLYLPNKRCQPFFDAIHSFSARGQNVDFWLLSKNNTCRLPLRGTCG